MLRRLFRGRLTTYRLRFSSTTTTTITPNASEPGTPTNLHNISHPCTCSTSNSLSPPNSTSNSLTKRPNLYSQVVATDEYLDKVLSPKTRLFSSMFERLFRPSLPDASLVRELYETRELALATSLCDEIFDRDDLGIDLLEQMLRVYSRAGSVERCENVFERMEAFQEPSDHNWYRLIRAFVKGKDVDGALSTFQRFLSNGNFPTLQILMILMKMYRSVDELSKVTSIFDSMESYGVTRSIQCYNFFLQTLSALDHKTSADMSKQLFSRMLNENVMPNLQTISLLIRHLCRESEFRAAMKLFSEADSLKIAPTLKLFNIFVSEIVRLGNWKLLIFLYNHFMKLGNDLETKHFGQLIQCVGNAGLPSRSSVNDKYHDRLAEVSSKIISDSQAVIEFLKQNGQNLQNYEDQFRSAVMQFGKRGYADHACEVAEWLCQQDLFGDEIHPKIAFLVQTYMKAQTDNVNKSRHFRDLQTSGFFQQKIDEYVNFIEQHSRENPPRDFGKLKHLIILYAELGDVQKMGDYFTVMTEAYGLSPDLQTIHSLMKGSHGGLGVDRFQLAIEYNLEPTWQTFDILIRKCREEYQAEACWTTMEMAKAHGHPPTKKWFEDCVHCLKLNRRGEINIFYRSRKLPPEFFIEMGNALPEHRVSSGIFISIFRDFGNEYRSNEVRDYLWRLKTHADIPLTTRTKVSALRACAQCRNVKGMNEIFDKYVLNKYLHHLPRRYYEEILEDCKIAGNVSGAHLILRKMRLAGFSPTPANFSALAEARNNWTPFHEFEETQLAERDMKYEGVLF